MEEISQPLLNFSKKMVTLQLVLEKYFMEGLLVLQLMTINLVMIVNIHGAKVVLITMLLTVIQKVEMYLGEDLINQHWMRFHCKTRLMSNGLFQNLEMQQKHLRKMELHFLLHLEHINLIHHG